MSDETRIYGINPGSCNPEVVEQAESWELFLQYYGVTYIAWRMRHDSVRDYGRGYISDDSLISIGKEMSELQYNIEYLMLAICQKEGITVSEPAAGQHITPDRETFMRWYRYYDNHFMHQLSDAEWRDFEAKRERGEDITSYLPTGDWHDSAA